MTWGYKGLAGVTRGHRKLQGFTGGYKELQGVKSVAVFPYTIMSYYHLWKA